jgi:hypothetical protein
MYQQIGLAGKNQARSYQQRYCEALHKNAKGTV